MKNLMKIFMAVVAGMFAFACATDATEDLGVQVGNGTDGATIELSLSVEESRTQLGEKVNGLYPVYWSAGDKISVNGVESGEAVINQSNPASATFAVGVSEAATYAVAYPAAPAGKVLFAEKQSHVAAGNTFASGVSTMYGYGESANNITLNHLTGVLKIGVKGEAVLAKAQISTIDRAPIAGAFDIDFETGEVAATTASKEVIEYSFGEGLQLSSTAQYIHVAVPAGKYEELYITLYEKGNSGNIMYATVKAGESKPLAAGNVREFSNNIIYVPNAKLFVIDSVEQLVAFKAAVEAEGGLNMDAIFTEDIDMTGVEWTPIAGENYTNTIIGNGYAIKGLTAPLFGTTSASVKGLHLKDVALVTNNTQYMGAIACVLDAKEGFAPKIENCSVSGTLTVKNPDYKVTASSNQSLRYGGIAGYSNSIAIDNCVNNIDFTVEQAVSEANDGASLETQICVGGMIGAGYKTTAELSNVTNCVNNGTITFSDTVLSTTNKARTWVAGIIGSMNSSNDGALLNDNTNNGDISVSSTLRGGVNYIAGIAGYTSSDTNTGRIDNCTNKGAISITSSSTTDLWVAGIVCYAVGTQAENSHNYGALSVGSQENPTLIIGSIYMAGFAVRFTDQAADAKIVNISNNAPITLWTAEGSYGGGYGIAGIIRWSQGDSTTVTNSAEGDITVNGSYALNSDTVNGYGVGGLFQYKTSNSGKECTNRGDITVNTTFTTHSSLKDKAQVFNIGGLASRTHQVIDGTNYGTITLNSDTSGLLYKTNVQVGGCLGAGDGSEKNNINRGTININGKHSRLYIGGAIGYSEGKHSDAENYGAINISGEISGVPCIGGIAGYSEGNVTDSENHGTITVDSEHTFPGSVYMAGITPYVAAMGRCYNYGNIEFKGSSASDSAILNGITFTATGLIKDCANYGNLTMSGTANNTHIYGIYYEAGDAITNCVNGEKGSTTKGVLTCSGQVNNGLYICGIGNKNSNKGMTSAVNYGPINMTNTCSTKSSTYIGGITKAFPVGATLTECVNYGDITLAGIVGDEAIGGNSGADTFVGGICDVTSASESVGTLVRCQNHGDVIYTETFKGANAVRTGGMVARFDNTQPTVIEDCWNSGDVIFNGKAGYRSAGTLKVGGFTGTSSGCPHAVKGYIINSGNVSISGEQNGGSTVYVAGVSTEFGKNLTLVEGETEALIANTGTITFNGSTKNTMAAAGIASTLSGTVQEGIKFVNTGNVTATGVVATAADKVSGVAGIIAIPKKPIPSAECYCTVNAMGYQGAGMLVGRPYTAGTVEVKAGKIGGTLYNRIDIITDASGDIEEIGPGALTAANFLEGIYSSVVTADLAPNIEHISEAPVVTLPAALPAVTE